MPDHPAASALAACRSKNVDIVLNYVLAHLFYTAEAQPVSSDN